MPRLLVSAFPVFLMLAPLSAQGVAGGVQVGISIPEGDAQPAVGSSAGFMVGGYVRMAHANGFTLRPGLTYRSFSGTSTPDGTQPYGYGTFKNVVDTLGLSLDGIYHFAGSGTGAYGLVGIGAEYTSYKSKGGTSLLSYGSDSAQATALGWTVGAGFDFTQRVGAELAYRSSQPSLNTYTLPNGKGFQNSALSLALTLTF